MSAKKITYILNNLTEDDTQHFVHIPALLKNLRSLGWSVEVISERGGSGIREVYGLPVRYLSLNGRLQRVFNLSVELLRARRKGCRIVFVRISKSAAFISAILGLFFGWKTLFWLSGAVEDFNIKKGGIGARLGFFSTWLLLRLVSRLVTGPEIMVEYYRDVYSLPAKKISMLYNDIDLTAIEGSNKVKKENELRVLLVHRLSPVRETVRYFPDIVNGLSDYCSGGASVTLDIIGEGPERLHLEEMSLKARNGLVILFHGAIPNANLSEYYNSADIFIMPSYREGFPRVILEAMARGLPIVSTDAGGTSNLVGEKQSAFVVSRDNHKEFALKINSLLASKDTRDDLSEENLLVVRRFSSTAVAVMYDELLKEQILDWI